MFQSGKFKTCWTLFQGLLENEGSSDPVCSAVAYWSDVYCFSTVGADAVGRGSAKGAVERVEFVGPLNTPAVSVV